MVNIFDKFFKLRKHYFSDKPKNFDFELKVTLKNIKKELNGHLDAINENTSEIQTSYGCMNEINDKLEKLTERVEAVEIFLQQHSNFNATE